MTTREALTREQIDECFDTFTHQSEVLLALYTQIIPDLGLAEEVQGYVKCSKAMWIYCCERFMAFDNLHHAGRCMAGGLWLNQGFSCDDTLPDDEVVLPPIKYKETPK